MNTEYLTPETPTGSIQTQHTSLSDYFIAACVCGVLTLFFLLTTPGLLHWFLFPTILCGILIGADGVMWFRGKCDTFDIKGLIGLFGFHFFFTAAFIYLYLGVEMPYVENPNDWRPWFGKMAFLNLVGIICYKYFQRIGFSGIPKAKPMWCMNPGRTWFVLNSAIVLSFLSQAFFFIRTGGIRGIMRAREEDVMAFFGMGVPRIMGSALPLLCFIAFALFIYYNRIPIQRHLFILVSLFVFGLIQLAVVGPFSSRGIIVTPLFWMFGIIHYFWRPLSQKFIIMILIPGFLFLWMYSFYKALGVGLFDVARTAGTVGDLAQRTGRTFGGMLVGDMSRVDVQAYILYVQQDSGRDYDLRYGRTYIEAVTPMIPYWVWPTKPHDAGKVVAATELMYGKGYYDRYAGRRTTRAYGLAGESMLNFGFWGVPIAFALWGFLVGRFRRWVNSLQPGDLRFLLIPYLIWFLPGMLVWDMDNYIGHTMLRAAFPLLIIYLMGEKVFHSYYAEDTEPIEVKGSCFHASFSDS